MDEDVAEEASRIGAQMVITHHPLIFGGISSICDSEPTGRAIMKLLADGISVYSCHTPFDKVKGGNNDAIAEMLGLEKVRNLRGDTVVSADKMAERKDEADIGRTGKLSEPMTCRQVLDIVSGQLRMSMRQLRFVGDMDREVETIGICTGAGADMMDMAAKAAGCQLFITGDVKYHEAREADQKGICIIDAGHYGTEKVLCIDDEGNAAKRTEERGYSRIGSHAGAVQDALAISAYRYSFTTVGIYGINIIVIITIHWVRLAIAYTVTYMRKVRAPQGEDAG